MIKIYMKNVIISNLYHLSKKKLLSTIVIIDTYYKSRYNDVLKISLI